MFDFDRLKLIAAHHRKKIKLSQSRRRSRISERKKILDFLLRLVFCDSSLSALKRSLHRKSTRESLWQFCLSIWRRLHIVRWELVRCYFFFFMTLANFLQQFYFSVHLEKIFSNIQTSNIQESCNNLVINILQISSNALYQLDTLHPRPFMQMLQSVIT